MLKVTAAPSGEAEANRVRLSPFLLVHSARPSRASDSAVLRETRAKWPAALLIDFSLLAGVCFIGIQIGEPGGHVTNPPQTRTHTHTQPNRFPKVQLDTSTSIRTGGLSQVTLHTAVGLKRGSLPVVLPSIQIFFLS